MLHYYIHNYVKFFQIQYIAAIGGSNGHYFVRNVIGSIMSNSLAMEYNFAGRPKKPIKKRSFRKLPIWPLIRGFFWIF